MLLKMDTILRINLILVIIICCSCHFSPDNNYSKKAIDIHQRISNSHLELLQNISIIPRWHDNEYIDYYYLIEVGDSSYSIPNFKYYDNIGRKNYDWITYGMEHMNLQDTLQILNKIREESNKVFKLYNEANVYSILGSIQFNKYYDEKLIMFNIKPNEYCLIYCPLGLDKIEHEYWKKFVMNSNIIDEKWCHGFR